MVMLGTRYLRQGGQGPGCRHKRPVDQVAVIKNIPCAETVLCVRSHPSLKSVRKGTNHCRGPYLNKDGILSESASLSPPR